MEENQQENEAHQQLMRSCQKQLRDFIFVLIPNHSAVEDILQETNCVLWEKRAQFELGTSYLAWAKQIARFQLLSYLKKNKSKSWLHFDSDLVQTLASEKSSRDEQAEVRAGHLKACTANLSDKDNELIRLRYELQLSLKEISAKTNRTTGGLKQAFWEIRNKLRDCIKRKLG